MTESESERLTSCIEVRRSSAPCDIPNHQDWSFVMSCRGQMLPAETASLSQRNTPARKAHRCSVPRYASPWSDQQPEEKVKQKQNRGLTCYVTAKTKKQLPNFNACHTQNNATSGMGIHVQQDWVIARWRASCICVQLIAIEFHPLPSPQQWLTQKSIGMYSTSDNQTPWPDFVGEQGNWANEFHTEDTKGYCHHSPSHSDGESDRL